MGPTTMGPTTMGPTTTGTPMMMVRMATSVQTTTAPVATTAEQMQPVDRDDTKRRTYSPSARVRILGWVLLLLLLAGTAALLLQRRVLLERLDDEVSSSLIQEADELRVLAEGQDPATGKPFAGDVTAIFDTFLRRNIPLPHEAFLTIVDGRPYKGTPAPYRFGEDPDLTRRWARLTNAEQGEVDTPAGFMRYLAVPLIADSDARGVFVVTYFLESQRHEIERTTQVGAAVYGSVLVLALGLAWIIAGRVLAPVRVVTSTARELTETDLSRRIPVPDTHDEIAELARTFNTMLDGLDRSFRDQRDFLNDAGHELRTPITVIRGHLELEGDDPDERRETRAIVLDELTRMARIVDDMLLLARSEHSEFLHLEPVDLDVLTADLLSKARAVADRDWRLAATGHGVLVVDRHRITQAVLNLVDNAIRHTTPGSTIELGSSMGSTEAQLWVRDDGPGVPPEQHEQIFGRFAHSTDGQRKAGSAGLGLAIVKAIVEAHRGRVKIDSRPGAGSTFTITVPTDSGDG